MNKFNLIKLVLLLVAMAALPGKLWGQTEAKDTIAGKELKEVVVEMENIVHHGTHDEVTITPAMRKYARNISEVIGKIPGFRYDPIGQAMTYMGNSKIKILVDSIDKQIEQVAQLGHQRFSRVDVIYNPTGKYQEYEILLNLHTKKNYEGFDLYVQNQDFLMPSGRNGKGKDFASWETSGLFNYVHNNWTFSIYAQNVWLRNGSSSYSAKEYPLNDLFETAIEQPRTSPTDFNTSKGVKGNVSVDYKFNDRHAISVIGNFNHTESTQRKYEDMTTMSPIHDAPYRESHLFNEKTDPIYDYWAGAYYYGYSERWSYSAMFNFSDGKTRNYSRNTRSGGFNLADNRVARGNYQAGDIDVSHMTANEKWVFNLNYRIINNRYRSYRLESGRMLTDSRQLTNRGTLTASYYPANDWSVKLAGGIQATRYSTGSTNDTRLSPRIDFSLSHNFTRKNWIRLYYNTTVNNPFLGNVTDYGQFTDSLMFDQGNPRLKPASEHTATLMFGLLNIVRIHANYGASPRQINKIYSQGFGERPDGLTGDYVISRMMNTKWHYWGFRVEASKGFGKWFLAGTVDISKEYASYNGISHSRWICDGDLMCVFNAPKIGLSSLLVYNISNGNHVAPQGYGMAHTDRFRLSVQKSFLKGKLDLSLNYWIPLHFMSGYTQEWLYSPAMNDHTWSNNQFRDDNKIMLRISYRLQKGAPVRKMNIEELGTD